MDSIALKQLAQAIINYEASLAPLIDEAIIATYRSNLNA